MNDIVTPDEEAASSAGNAAPACREQTAELLQMLATLGQVREVNEGLWCAE